MAVGSNSISPTIETMLGKAGLSQYFEFFISADQVAAGKPCPDIYLEAMDRLDVKPKECLILEDNFNGIQAAKRSGAHVLEIQNVNDVNLWNIKSAIASVSVLP